MEKTVNNTTASEAKKNVSDLEIWGNGDTFKLICKAISKKEGWMKSTKAMEIPEVGCVVQITTQQRNETALNAFNKNEKGELEFIQPEEGKSGYAGPMDLSREANNYSIAEAVTFVPGVKIEETMEGDKVVSRKLVKI